MEPPPLTTDHVGDTGIVTPAKSLPTAVNCWVPVTASVCGLGVMTSVASVPGALTPWTSHAAANIAVAPTANSTRAIRACWVSTRVTRRLMRLFIELLLARMLVREYVAKSADRDAGAWIGGDGNDVSAHNDTHTSHERVNWGVRLLGEAAHRAVKTPLAGQRASRIRHDRRHAAEACAYYTNGGGVSAPAGGRTRRSATASGAQAFPSRCARGSSPFRWRC